MAYQAINLGTAPNDNTGDPARTAGQKINENFVELYTLGNPTTGTITADSIVNSAGTGAPNFPNGLTVGTKGTFTPTVSGATTAGVGTYLYQYGWYTRIANRVFFNATITVTAHTGTGDMRLTDLPLVSDSTFLNRGTCSIRYSNLLVGAGKELTSYIEAGSNFATFEASDPAGGAVTPVPIDTNFAIVVSGQYEV